MGWRSLCVFLRHYATVRASLESGEGLGQSEGRVREVVFIE